VTGRKPPGLGWESWTERQIEEGRRAGLFDGLDGEGKPIDGLDGPHDEEWWVKAKLRREKIAYLPPTIAIRRERDAAVAAALDAPDEAEARRLIEEVNERIRYVNSHTVAGPPSTVWVVDVESILERRRQGRPGDSTDDEPPGDEPLGGEPLDGAEAVVAVESVVAGRRRRPRWLTVRRA
jgi:hypothetical protein